MFQTLARQASAIPTPIMMRGEALTSSSGKPFELRSGSTRKV
jgi:hypothetical protein